MNEPIILKKVYLPTVKLTQCMKRRILLVLSVLAGLMFINAGLNKLLNYIPVPNDLPGPLVRLNTAIMEIGWLLPLVAVAEIVGGILLLFPRTRAVGAIVLFPVAIGILLVHLTVAPSGLPIALILLAILIWVMLDSREKFTGLIR